MPNLIDKLKKILKQKEAEKDGIKELMDLVSTLDKRKALQDKNKNVILTRQKITLYVILHEDGSGGWADYKIVLDKEGEEIIIECVKKIARNIIAK